MGCGSSTSDNDVSEGSPPKGGGGGGGGRGLGVLPNATELLSSNRHPQIDLILPNLYLGNMMAANNSDLLQKKKIKRVLNATPHQPPFPQLFTYKNVRIEDVQGTNVKPYLEKANTFIAEGLEAGEPVFVHCEMGMSRSTTMILAYLMLSKGWTVHRAFFHVRLCRPVVRVTRTFIYTLIDLQEHLHKDQSLDSTLLSEEGLEHATPSQLSAHSIQLFFFPSISLVQDRLRLIGKLPSDWDSLAEKYFAGVDKAAFDEQEAADLGEIEEALEAKGSTKKAMPALKKRYPNHISPFVK